MSAAIKPRYLRVSLLSACNLRCSYCMPSGQERQTMLAPENKVRSAIRFMHQVGIRKIRFTGGEPTLFKGLPEMVSYVKTIDKEVHTAITSNGVLIDSMAQKLALAGLDSANISIDTLDHSKFRTLTGRPLLDRVISGIDAATEHISSVKLNCVLMRGVNDDEASAMISFADQRGLDIRFIEFMPNHFSTPGDPRFISSEETRNRLSWELKPIPGKPGSAARYYTAPSLGIKVGFISSVSHPFCSGCDRLRLTASGLLYSCLYDSGNINLFELLASDTGRALSKFDELVRMKQFGGCHPSTNLSDRLPSFSTMGG